MSAVDGRPAAMLALARIEAARALRHPVTVLAAALYTATWLVGWVTDGVPRTPVLQDEDHRLQFALALLLGGAALVAVNLAVLRPRRHAAVEQFDTLPLPAPWRTGALLLAPVPVALLAGLLDAVRVAVLAAQPAAAGRLSPYELVTAPVAVLLFGTIGVLLGRLVPTVVVGPLAVMALVVTLFLGIASAAAATRLLPVVLGSEDASMPVHLMDRPAGWHLTYLVGLAALVAAGALAHSGARPREWRLVALVAAGLVATLVAGAAQLRGPGAWLVAARRTATEAPAGQQVCRRVAEVTYCAFPDYTPWVGEWDAVVRGVLRRVPGTEARRPLVVRQRVWTHDASTGTLAIGPEQLEARARLWRAADEAAGTPNAVTVGTSWGDGRAEIGLAGFVAYEVMTRAGAGVFGGVCGSRAVLLGWLAGQATPDTAAGLRAVDDTSWGGVPFEGPAFGSGVTVSDREMAVVWALLDLPAERVAAVVGAHWAELTAADTPTERIGELLGVPVGPQPPERERSTCTA